MKLSTIKPYIIAFVLTALLTSCNNDDDTIIDPDIDVIDDDGDTDDGDGALDFSGTFAQEDQKGRPGINTVFSPTPTEEEAFNTTIPSQLVDNFQPIFLQRAVDLYGAFGAEYENNILGLDAPTLTTILAADVLQVAPDSPTTYFDGTNLLTGRNLTDDVIDISLILIFGGMNGDRFNGQDLDGDGTPDLPILVTDGVGNEGVTPLANFPYLENPI